jgi:hypothetical protein
MIAKQVNGNCFAKIELMPNGKVVRFAFDSNIETAHWSSEKRYIYDNLESMRKDGWELLPPDPTCQTLSAGEMLTDGQYFMRVLAFLGGYGELATYDTSGTALSRDDDDYLKKSGASWTAYELVNDSWKPLPPEPAADAKADECLKYLESVGKVKDGKVVVK